MANDHNDALTTGALFLGGGAAGYAAGRWLFARWVGKHAAQTAPRMHLPAPPMPAAQMPATARPASAPPALPPAAYPHSTPAATGPVTSPSQVDPNVTGPVTSPSQAGPIVTGPVTSPSQVGPSVTGPVTSPSELAPSVTGPVTSPSQVGPNITGPVTSPSQVDPSLGAARPSRPRPTPAVSGPITSPSQIDPSLMTTPPSPQRPTPTATGPITSPSQVTPISTPTRGTGLSREFDPIFERYRDSLPIEYLRALAMRESGMNPDERSGPAWGLMQIVEVARHGYNKAHRTRYTREQLLDPAVNIAIACWLLHEIIASYHRNHTDTPNLRADWNNLRFVELLTFGWNAGYSEIAGVGRVARYLEQRSTQITLDTVHQYAAAAGAVRHLSEPERFTWCKTVAELYQRERGVGTSAHRGASWWSIKTPSVILDEMRAAKSEIEALGRDIYATYVRPYEAQHAAAEERFFKTYGRKPGIGGQAKDTDYQTVRSWMQPVPTDADWGNISYQGQFVAQWREFEHEFGDFWSSHSGSWTERMWRGAYDKAVEYRERAAEWRKRFEKIGGTPTTPPPKPPTEHFFPPGVSIPWKAIAAVGGVAAGVLIIPAALRASRRD